MTIRIKAIGENVWVPYLYSDQVVADSFGASDEVNVTVGRSLAWWKEFRDSTGCRIIRPI